ncbi:MAG: DUF1543 domain-containing protein [Bacteroidota bacterium]|jgi:predicted ATP-grasp superfamily ATP-dependent carboligase
MEKLFAVLLGGKIRPNNLMEDHQLVFIVAENEKQARKLAKLKWPEADSIHIDGTQLIEQVDGFKISLKKEDTQDDLLSLNNNYSI